MKKTNDDNSKTILNDLFDQEKAGHAELKKKQDAIRRHETELKYDEIERVKAETAKLSSESLNSLDAEKLLAMKQTNSEYFESAKSAPLFILPDFRYLVIPAVKNIILVAAPSGNGKGTVCANAIYSFIGQGKRVLVISNEELANDVFNRVTCLMKGWAYTKHNNYTDEQVKILNDNYAILNPSLTVVDGNMAETSSIDGIQVLLEDLYKMKNHYDLVIIDYYQNIDHSTKNPKLDINDTQSRFVKFLDRFKNKYPAPILLLAQVAVETRQDRRSFKERIEGRKLVMNVATVAIELVTDHAECRTEWIFHKSRFSSAGVRLSTGWDRGLYVAYSDDFKAEVAKRNIDAALKKKNEAGHE